MLEYDRIDVSKGIDVKKTNGLHECIISISIIKIFDLKEKSGSL